MYSDVLKCSYSFIREVNGLIDSMTAGIVIPAVVGGESTIVINRNKTRQRSSKQKDRTHVLTGSTPGMVDEKDTMVMMRRTR